MMAAHDWLTLPLSCYAVWHNGRGAGRTSAQLGSRFGSDVVVVVVVLGFGVEKH